jgi:cation diffusion facilitator CzcD-associated flavoprotein CzcO/3-oxoacyl-(acyl-carrier-protein) synthase
MSNHRDELKLLQQKLSIKNRQVSPPVPAETRSEPAAPETDSVAIVGMHGYLPGCMSVSEFWSILDHEQSVITEIPPSRFSWEDYYDPSGKDVNKMRTRWGGFIPVIDAFDPLFFKVAPNDAHLLDPQQRLLLMSVWKSIEDAGHAPGSLKGTRTGVYIGMEDQEYLQELKDTGVDLGDNMLNHHPSMLANRISYFFDFEGPSEIVNTMCSSAAVALHRASCALRNGEIDNAIVGAAKIILRPDGFIALSRLNMATDAPVAKSFGKEANGYIRAEGVATVMLKRLADARRDGDHIYAAIISSAINFNGAKGMSFAAPDPEAHAKVIRQCYGSTGIDPRDVEYIEAQGMGNQVSDIAEWQACNKAIKELCDERSLGYQPGFCAVSTLKPVIGHMECASAMGALFKIIHSFNANKLYKILNLSEVNPYLELDGMPCRLLTETEEWSSKGRPRLAGLHSYGSGGNNAHLLVSEVSGDTSSSSNTSKEPMDHAELFVFSARTAKSLEQYCREFVAFLASDAAAKLRLADIAFTLRVGREPMRQRLAIVAANRRQLLERLQAFIASPWSMGQANESFQGTASSKQPAGEALSDFEWPLSDEDCKELASLWVSGTPVEWSKLHDGRNLSRVSLPTYQFSQESYWISGGPQLKSEVRKPVLTMKPRSSERRVVVVGAGPAGLATARCLQDEGFDPVILEGSDRIGGIWAYRDNYASGPYKSTLTQLSKYTFFFSDFPPEESDPLFCDVGSVNRYLNRYIDHFGLRSRIKLRCNVQQVSPEGSAWKVAYYNAQEGIGTLTAMGVACCSGSFWQPTLPEFARKTPFSGLAITASAYHSNEIFGNKRVLVIGAGVSGADIASDAAEVAAKCSWSVRGLGWFLPRMLGFVPNDCSVSFVKRFVNLQISRTEFIDNLRRALPEYMHRYERTGLIPKDAVNNAIFISDRIIDHVYEGRVTVRPEITGFDDRRAHFSDGHSDEFDVVVFCTGYEKPGYEWLRPIRLKDFNQNLFYRENPTLFICNHPPGIPAFGSAPPYLELLGRWYAGVLSGCYQPPQIDDRETASANFFDAWLDSLRIAHEIGVLPDPRTDWTNYWKFINMPPIPALFRIHGRQSWSGAEQWVEHVRRKCFLGSNSADARDLKLAILAGLQAGDREHLRRTAQITDEEFAAAQSFQEAPVSPWLTVSRRQAPLNGRAMTAVASGSVAEGAVSRRVVAL